MGCGRAQKLQETQKLLFSLKIDSMLGLKYNQIQDIVRLMITNSDLEERPQAIRTITNYFIREENCKPYNEKNQRNINIR